MSKLPHNLLDEELLKVLIEQNDPAPPVEQALASDPEDDVLRFLSAFNFQTGPNKVTVRMLYSLYKKWSAEAVGAIVFGRRIGKFFFLAGNNNRLFVTLNHDPFFLYQKTKAIFDDRKIDKRKSPKFKQHFDAFLTYYGISKGEQFTDVRMLFYLYDLWTTKNNARRAFGIGNFTKFCDMYFEGKDTKKGKFFGIHGIKKHLPREKLKQLREGYRRDARRKGKR